MDDSHIRSIRKVNQDSYGLTLPKEAIKNLNEELDVEVQSCNVIIEVVKNDDGSVRFEVELLK